MGDDHRCSTNHLCNTSDNHRCSTNHLCSTNNYFICPSSTNHHRSANNLCCSNHHCCANLSCSTNHLRGGRRQRRHAHCLSINFVQKYFLKPSGWMQAADMGAHLSAF